MKLDNHKILTRKFYMSMFEILKRLVTTNANASGYRFRRSETLEENASHVCFAEDLVDAD